MNKYTALFLLLFAAGATAFAQEGKKMTFQGSLYQNEQPFNGTTPIEFSIALDSVSSWTETLTDVNVVNGLYSVVLGNTNPLPEGLFFNTPERVMTVKVDGVTLGNVTLYAPFSPGISDRFPGSLRIDKNGLDIADILTYDYTGVSGAQLNVRGYNNNFDSASPEYNGGGVSLGSKFYDTGDGSAQRGYLHLRGTVNPVNYFDANLKFTLEAIDQGNGAEGAEFLMYGNILDSASKAKPVLNMNSVVSGDNLAWGSEVSLMHTSAQGESQTAVLNGLWGYMDLKGLGGSPNIGMGGRFWEGNSDLAYFNLTGNVQVDGGYPTSMNMNVETDGTEQWANMAFSIQEAGGAYSRPMTRLDYDGNTGTGYFELYGNTDDGGGYPARNRLGIDSNGLGYLELTGYGGEYYRLDANGIGSLTSLNIPNPTDGSTISDLNVFSNGTQLNLKGLKDSLTGGGVSLGTKWFTNNPADTQLGYIHLRGTPAGASGAAYFDTPLKFTMEATNRGDGTEGAEFFMYGNTLDANSKALPVLSMSSASSDTLNSSWASQVSLNRTEAGSSTQTILLDGLSGDISGNSLTGANSVDLANGESTYGVKGEASGTGADGFGSQYSGVLGIGNGAVGDNAGVRGIVDVPAGNSNPGFSKGVQGTISSQEPTATGYGLRGDVSGQFGFTSAVRGIASNTQGNGDIFQSNNLGGFFSASDNPEINVGVVGDARGDNAAGSRNIGVSGEVNTANSIENIGVFGTAANASGDNWAGYFLGNTKVTMDLSVDGNVAGNSVVGNSISLGNGRVQMTSNNNGNGDFGDLKLYSTAGTGSNQIGMGFADTNETAGFISLWNSDNELALMNVVLDSTGNSYGSLNLSGASSGSIQINGGSGDINISGTLTQSSDRRLKADIQTLDNTLNNVLEMRGVAYRWKDTKKDQRTQIGVIAQEVEEVYPEFVHTNNDGEKAVNYAQMTAVLIEAIKELNEKVESLETENVALKADASKASDLESRLAQIEKLLGVKVSEESNVSEK